MLGLQYYIPNIAVRGGVRGPRIVLDGYSQPEGTAIGTVIGQLSIINGGEDEYTLTITVDDDNAFEIFDGDYLRNTIVFDREVQETFQVTIEADDGVTTPITRTFTITVTDQTETFVLREDGSYVLREDGARVMRETF